MVHGLLSILVLIISIILLVFVCVSLRKIVGTYRIPLVSSFFILYYIIIIFIGSVLLNIYPFQYEFNLGFYERPDLVLNIWIYSAFGLILLLFGMFSANIAFNYNPFISTKAFLEKRLIISVSDRSLPMKLILYSVFGISLIVLFMYISKIDELPILGIFKGLSGIEIAQLRSSATNNFPGKYWRYALFIKHMPLMILLIIFFLKNVSLSWKLSFYILLAYCVFGAVIDGQKSPLITLILLLVIVYFYKKNRINKKILFIGIIFSIFVILIMYVFFMGLKGRSISVILNAPIHRIFIGQIHPFFWYQRYIEENGYLYGLSFPNPAGIFPFEYLPLTKVISVFAFPQNISKEIVGSMPAVFFAEWLVNFGPLMAFFSMILWGFILQTVDIIFVTKLKIKKGILLSSLYVYLIIFLSQFAGSSFIQIIFEEKILLFVIIIIMIIMFRMIIIRNIKIGLMRG